MRLQWIGDRRESGETCCTYNIAEATSRKGAYCWTGATLSRQPARCWPQLRCLEPYRSWAPRSRLCRAGPFCLCTATGVITLQRWRLPSRRVLTTRNSSASLFLTLTFHCHGTASTIRTDNSFPLTSIHDRGRTLINSSSEAFLQVVTPISLPNAQYPCFYLEGRFPVLSRIGRSGVVPSCGTQA